MVFKQEIQYSNLKTTKFISSQTKVRFEQPGKKSESTTSFRSDQQKRDNKRKSLLESEIISTNNIRLKERFNNFIRNIKYIL